MSESPAQRDRDAVLARVDLVALADALLQRGHNGMWSCPNPDHTQTGLSPPLNVFDGDDGGQRWHCFGCSDGGTAVDLLLRTNHSNTAADALDWLARVARIAPPVPGGASAHSRREKRERRWWELDLFAYVKVCAALLAKPGAAGPRRWLTETRAIPNDVIDAALVGFDPGYRALPREDGIPTSPAIVVPIREPADHAPGWQARYALHRVLRPRPGQARWLNTASRLARNPGVGFFDPPQRSRSALVVTEGPMDALSALAAGHRAAALLGEGGVNLGVAQRLAAALHRSERLVLAFDNDPAGQRQRESLEALLRNNTGIEWDRLEIPPQYNDLNEWHVACRENWRAVLGAGVQQSRLRPSRPSARLPPVGVSL